MEEELNAKNVQNALNYLFTNEFELTEEEVDDAYKIIKAINFAEVKKYILYRLKR